jgi:hypothetical protein
VRTDNGVDQTPSGIKPKPPVPPKEELSPQAAGKIVIKKNPMVGQTPGGIKPKPPVPPREEGASTKLNQLSTPSAGDNQMLGQTPSGIKPKPPVPTKVDDLQQNQK